ncbi:SCO family protein [Piscinibacter sp.]|mgnify:CR=1 FL=1|jgi:protein SCO1/2|uniref:SCO family protein n=1 Tax=Piscinibacter sp. TaxID=1903157 RepID=UPI001D28E510|nr:SCO family protein [Piscinibacter sp.]MBK7531156.1 SCO family protein [Piscinibacter sp.]MBL0093375.1 SCO family protein [Piscinibacter sp.]HOX68737.1 SCO family protein [Burkholderiaceae bacterium]
MKTPDGPLALMSRRASLRCLAGCTLGLTVGAAGAQARSDKARAWFTDTTLIDQDHRPHAFYSDLLAPRAVLINAAFVGCSSACPLLTQQLVKVREGLGDRFGRDIWFLSITVDPLSDGPDELKRFAQRQGADAPGWRFLTGAPQDVKLVLGRLGLWVESPDAHQTGLIAGRAAGGHWGKLRPDGSSQALVQQLARFLAPA